MPSETFVEYHSQSYRITSEESSEAAIESIKTLLSREIYNQLIQGQNEAVILNLRVGVDRKPDGGTYVSRKGLDKLSGMLGEILDKVLVQDQERGTLVEVGKWENAKAVRDLLREIQAAKGGWV